MSKFLTNIQSRIPHQRINPLRLLFRYNRGNRSLAANLSSGPKVSSDSGSANQRAGDEDEDYDIPDEIEDVIGNGYSAVVKLKEWVGCMRIV